MSVNEKTSLREQLRKDGYVVQPTVGNSMEPLLFNRHSLVKIASAGGELPNLSVALYQRPNGQYLLHRIVKVRKHDYLIIGDNQSAVEVVPKQWILGVLTDYATDGIHWQTVRDRAYQDYVAKHMERFWLRYYTKRLTRLPRRAIRKLKRVFGSVLKHRAEE